MASLRRNLRVFATTWLVFQVLWLTALVPRDCCAAHRPAEKSCHEAAAAETEPAEHQQHIGAAAPLPQQASTPSTDCRLFGLCDGPMAAFFALLSQHGVLPESTESLPNDALRASAPAVHESGVSQFVAPDSPPPRA